MSEMQAPARRRMEPFDALMFRSDADPRVRSTTMGLQIVDRVPDWDRLVESYERISRIVPSIRQRVVEPPLPLTMPVWAVDPDFDLSYHLRRARVPAPGTMRQLLDFLEPMSMAPLDRTRPLWEFILIDGLDDGSAAWFTRMSHAVADGVAGQQLSRLSSDAEREPPPMDMPAPPPGDDLSPTDLARQAVADAPGAFLATAARGTWSAIRAGNRLARQPARTLSDAVAYAQSLSRVVGGPPAEPSPLLRHRSLSRRMSVLEIGLDELKAASKAGGGSLNDGFLAAVAGGLRRYHEQCGVPVESIPVGIPINRRSTDDKTVGNRWSGARFALPTGVVDPVERMQQIRQLVLAARQERAIDAANLLTPVAARLPTWLLSTALASTSGGHDVQISNVAGSPMPRYFAGAKVLKVFPFGPVPGPAAMITLYSYLGTCFVGINVDGAAVTDSELFTKCLQSGVDEILALRRPARSRRRSR
jgi:diacylglycerol O-acyltransferase